MHNFRLPLAVLALAVGATACSPSVPVVVTPSPSPAASPTAPTASAFAAPGPTASPSAPTAATPAPSVAPSAVASASASPAAATPAPAGTLDLTKGKLLRKYDFNNIGGLHFDVGRNQIYVIDATDDDATDRRYLLRRFNRDGTFEAAVDLHKASEEAPEAVDGLAFDLAGVPAFTYLEDEDFSLRRLYTATVLDATRLPSTGLERAGLAALGADGDVFTLGVIRLDPDALEGDTRDREILYIRAEEDEPPEANFRIRDPFEPTKHMALAPGGVLYLVGSTTTTLGVKRLTKDQQLADLPIPLPRIPDHVWTDPAGNLLLVTESTGAEPAKLRRYAPSGEAAGETDLTLASGEKIFSVDGLTFDAENRVILAGSAIAADLQTTTGIFTFD